MRARLRWERAPAGSSALSISSSPSRCPEGKRGHAMRRPGGTLAHAADARRTQPAARAGGGSARGVVGVARAQGGALVLDLRELALEALPRTVLGLVVIAAGQVAERVAVRLPGAVRPLVEFAQLALVAPWGGDVHRAPPIRRGPEPCYSYPATALSVSPRATPIACRP